MKSQEIKSIIESRFLATLERLITREMKSLLRKANDKDVIIAAREKKDSPAGKGQGSDDEAAPKGKPSAGDDSDHDSDTDNEDKVEEIGDGDAKQDDRLHKATYDESDEEEELDKAADHVEDLSESNHAGDAMVLETELLSAKDNIVADCKYVVDYGFDSKNNTCEIILEVFSFLP